jgi:hypothetical protein
MATKTLTAADYQKAIDVQDACNLCGVAQSFAAIIKEIPHNSTDERNQHPIVQLFVYKMFLLAFPHVALPEGFEKPFQQCSDAAEGKIIVN